jgi:general secretion pathway protein A
VVLEDVQSAIDELQWQEFAARGTAQTQSAAALSAGPQIDHSATGRFNTIADNARKGPELYVGPQDTGKHEAVPEAPLAKLVVVAEGRTIGELALRMGRTIIGRTPDNDLQIDSRFVSRHHCQIVTKADGSVVEDLNNGPAHRRDRRPTGAAFRGWRGRSGARQDAGSLTGGRLIRTASGNLPASAARRGA